MRLLKPAWVTHGGKPILSIDIHPDGSRFATGGQGDCSGKVVIWNMAPVRNEKDEKDKSVPKVLCQMDHHLGCVNCVRWSHNGKYLASAGDDKLIMIWQTSRSVGVSTVFGSAGKLVNVEQWRVGSTLKGHSGDVLDIAWSPHDVWLASCSVDNTVIVWNALKFPEQVCVLRGHTALVKGVTWDPINKYLASQSDDRSLRIWRTLDWQEEAAITQPFQECGGTTSVLRLDWSPDGYYIVSAHAMNNCGPTAQIVEREGWKCGYDFVGHCKAVTVVRFNPNILSRASKGANKLGQYSCCAIGSKDRSLSIWLTALKRPLVVTRDLFTNTILDISWSHDGMELLCCSWDGTVAFLSFLSGELGEPLSQDAKFALQAKTYGSSVLCNSVSSNRVIETTSMLSLHEPQPAKPQQPTPPEPETIVLTETPQKPPAITTASKELQRTPNSNISSLSLSPGKSQNKQIETRTRDGKRRITPILLAAQQEFGDVPLPYSSSTQPTFSSSTELSQIVVEKANQLNADGGGGGGQEMPATPVDAVEKASPLKSSSTERSTAQTPTSSRVVDCERDSDLTSSGNKHKMPPSSLMQPAVPKKKDGRGRPRKDRSLEAKAAGQLEATPGAMPAVAQKIVCASPNLKLPACKLQQPFSVQLSSRSEHLIEVHNGAAAGSSHVLHKLRCLQDGKVKWDAQTTSTITACTANSEITCIACQDRSVQLYSTESGRKLSPSMVLEAAVSAFVSNGHFLMTVTTKGGMFVWNVMQLSAVISNQSLLSIIPNDEVKVEGCQLTLTGQPLVTMNNGKVYTYMNELGCWVLLLNKSDRLDLSSDHHSCVPRSENSLKGPLALLQATQQRSGRQASDLYHASSVSRQTCTRSYLENQLACAKALQSPTEYQFWLVTYVRYLVQQGLQIALRECCDDLLGPVCRTKSNSSWTSTILGYKKRELLEEILPLIGSNLQLQRLYTEYHEQLEMVK